MGNRTHSFVHPSAAPTGSTKLQRMNAPFWPGYADSYASTPGAHGGSGPATVSGHNGAGSSLIDVSTSDQSSTIDSHARGSYEHTATYFASDTYRGNDIGNAPPGLTPADTIPSTQVDNPPDASRLGQPLTLADLPALARHLAPLLQDQQAENPPQYGP